MTRLMAFTTGSNCVKISYSTLELYNMKLMNVTTYISIVKFLDSKIVDYTKSALFWLSLASIVITTLPFHWYYALYVILYNLLHKFFSAAILVAYNDDALYHYYDKTGELKIKMQKLLNKDKAQ